MVHFHFSVLPSTNQWMKEHLLLLARDKLTFVSAEEQTAGRGRFGRKWHGGKGANLLGSFAFFVKEELVDPLSLTHLLAICTCRMAEQMQVKARIKWPNDVMVDHKKMAGVLCETVQVAPLFGIVMGMGLNVNATTDMLCDVGQSATSLMLETGSRHDIDALTENLKTRFHDDLTRYLAEGFQPFLPALRSLILPGIKNQHIL